MPVAINSSRPESSNSNGPSNSNNGGGGGGGPNSGNVNMNAAAASGSRPTTTSRRGGRSRSPVSNSVSASSRNVPPAPDGENPSSAAAAAAAAAKAYARPWDEDAYRHGPPPPYDKGYGPPPPHPPSSWPGEYRGGGGGGSSSRYSGYEPRPYGGSSSGHPRDDYDRRYGGSSHHSHHGGPPPPPHHHPRESRYDDRRYGPPPSHRESSSSSRGMPPYPPPPDSYRYHPRGPPPPPSHMRPSDHHHHGPPPPPHYRSSRSYRGEPLPPPSASSSSRKPPPPSSSSSSSRLRDHHRSTTGPSPSPEEDEYRSNSRAGTTLIFGGATPIHLPKSPVVSTSTSKPPPHPHPPAAPEKQQQRRTSIFRDRPDEEPTTKPTATAAATSDANNNSSGDEDSPQKILLSLRTPSTSFEERDKSSSGSSKKKVGGLSPDVNENTTDSKEKSPEQLFETQRSGDLVTKTGSIDMAPSFNLFNQSFDSFGDSHYFNVDSTLQADSFGLGRTESVGNEVAAQVLKNSSSGGNASAQLLAQSASGALTIGYSPVNSFSNMSSSAQQQRNRGESSTMVVGGQDARSTSPTQVLGMYRSYSGGGGPRPLDDSHMRMSVGSFGAHSMGYNRSYSENPSASPISYYNAMGGGSGSGAQGSIDASDRIAPFYTLLKKYRAAFVDCSFLLPGLKTALLEDSDKAKKEEDNGEKKTESEEKGSSWEPKSIHSYQSGAQGAYGEPTPQDSIVAKRRVESSICAFGGNLNKDKARPRPQTNKDEIFRTKAEDIQTKDEQGAPDEKNGEIAHRKKARYEEALPNRYYENDSRLSWEFEEDPPIEVTIDDDPDDDIDEHEKAEGMQSGFKSEHDPSKEEKNDIDDDQYCQSVSSETHDGSMSDKKTPGSPQSKMRYRCKLCGQPKQNHRCPYQQSLARSIGAMVYPAVNAFTADEPGTLAAPLSEMNNFVDIQRDSSDASSTRPTPERMHRMSGPVMVSTAQVTPESLRSSSRGGRPIPPYHHHSRKKRMYSQMKGGAPNDQGDLLFVESMELKPEQFRIISQSKALRSKNAYVYPSLPLPYAQRKRLSDNLFSLSNEIPRLTDECAQVLREAREKDMWDLAVAELMTQVIVVIHCTERDYRLEGLRQYLLTLGIAC